MGIFCRVYKEKLRFSITFPTSGPTAREKQYLPRYRDFCDFFEFLTPVKWEFFFENAKKCCVFKLPFERVVPRPRWVKTRRVIKILVFRGYSKKVSLGR